MSLPPWRRGAQLPRMLLAAWQEQNERGQGRFLRALGWPSMKGRGVLGSWEVCMVAAPGATSQLQPQQGAMGEVKA